MGNLLRAEEGPAAAAPQAGELKMTYRTLVALALMPCRQTWLAIQ